MVEMGEQHRAAGQTFEQWALDGPGHLTESGHQVMAEVEEKLASGTLPSEWDWRSHCAAQFGIPRQ
jgi:hypothetical protein